MANISYADFSKLDLRIGRVIASEKIVGADKLLKLTIDLGEELPRQLVAGIAQEYQPDELIGKDMVILSNLEPKKIRGVESQGMILAAAIENKSVILTVDKPVPPGSPIQ